MLDNSLCIPSVLFKVRETDAIDARGLSSHPTTPNQARDIEQERRVVDEQASSGRDCAGGRHRQNGRAHDVHEALQLRDP
jgi:hypothetical protein